jgi:hypothetical protein
MTTTFPVAHVYCPGCKTGLTTDVPGMNRCPTCGWTGEFYMFQPATLSIESAELALPDDATCIHHPRKKATAVCAGTGDYICSLCKVDLHGQTYSAQYLEAGGKEKAAKAFDRKLDRPDSKAALYLALPLIPYLNFGAALFGFILLPHGFILLARARRLRREDPIYFQLISPLRLAVLTILMAIYSLAWFGGVFFLIYTLAARHGRY